MTSTRSPRLRAFSLVVAITGTLLAALTPPAHATPSIEGTQAATPPTSGDANGDTSAIASVTLVTGEVVHLVGTPGSTGVPVVEVVGDRSAVAIHTDSAGDVHVLPADLLARASGRIDPQLFNVSALARAGYGVNGNLLPLRVMYADGTVELPGTARVGGCPVVTGSR